MYKDEMSEKYVIIIIIIIIIITSQNKTDLIINTPH